MLTRIGEWPFNAFILDNVTGGHALPVLCVHLFHEYGLIRHFQLDTVRLWKCFLLIEEGYHASNPYHNSIHATDVTQAMHCYLQEEKVHEHMTPLELAAALLAAVTHDLDHPGVNQPFLIATANHLASLYKLAVIFLPALEKPRRSPQSVGFRALHLNDHVLEKKYAFSYYERFRTGESSLAFCHWLSPRKQHFQRLGRRKLAIHDLANQIPHPRNGYHQTTRVHNQVQ
ncbi:unnamed protein product, partial [Darwinula stevensoni]